MPPINEEPQTINNVWGQATPTDTIEFLTLPSGQTCNAKRLGLEGMIVAGLLGEADSLSSFIGKEHVVRFRDSKKGGQVTEEINANSMMRDPKALQRVMLMVDLAIPHIVVEPAVQAHVKVIEEATGHELPKTELVKRQAGVIYTDQISLDDKMFLFNYAVGGTRDLERFREESRATVASVANGEGVPVQAQRPAGNRAQRRRRR